MRGSTREAQTCDEGPPSPCSPWRRTATTEDVGVQESGSVEVHARVSTEAGPWEGEHMETKTIKREYRRSISIVLFSIAHAVQQ